MRKLRVAGIQMKVSADKRENLRTAEAYIEKVKNLKPDVVVLPEMFICPYQTENFPVYAEKAGGESYEACTEIAKRFGIYLVAGSMPEIEDGKVYNTAYVFDRNGKQIARHRKAHLFDICVSGGQCFQESETLTPGNEIVVFDTEFCKMGLCVCYDFRFPELVRLMADKGAEMVLVPAAFNMTTGPAHWEILFRTRALDNQLFVMGVAPARDLESPYISWGHSILVDPWGKIIKHMDEKEGSMVHEIDLEQVKKVREELPLLKHRRRDLYELKEL